jgi:glycosyltransferase involved in cell wall biosynthesis
MVRFRGPLLYTLAESGHRIFAFAVDYDEESEQRVRELGAEPVRYRLDRVGMHPLRDLSTVIQLRRLFLANAIDRVLTYFIKPVVYGTIAARSAGVEERYALLPGLGYAFRDDGGSQAYRQRAVRSLVSIMLRRTLAYNDRTIVYNSNDAMELTRRRLVDADRLVRVNGTGVDLSEYPFSSPPVRTICFLLAARLLKAKGVRDYAAAARCMKQKYPETRFVLLGGMERSPDALQEAEVQGWVEEGILDWPGSVPDVRPWLNEASVYVLPTYYREGVPRSIQEALATGRPVITTDAPGCRETVDDGVNGYLVPVRNETALANAMERFIKQPHLVARMGAESRRIAEERYDVHKINRALMGAMGL